MEFVMNKCLLIPQPGFMSEPNPNNSRLENFLDSILTDEGALTIPFAYQVEITRGTKNTIYIASGMLVAGAILTALIIKNKI